MESDLYKEKDITRVMPIAYHRLHVHLEKDLTRMLWTKLILLRAILLIWIQYDSIKSSLAMTEWCHQFCTSKLLLHIQYHEYNVTSFMWNENNTFFYKPYCLIRSVPGGTRLVLQSGLAQKRTTLSDRV